MEYPLAGFLTWDIEAEEDEDTLKFIERQEIRAGGLDDYFKKLKKITKTRITKRANGTLPTKKTEQYSDKNTWTAQDNWVACNSPAVSLKCNCNFFPHAVWCLMMSSTKTGNRIAKQANGGYCSDCGLSAPNHRTWCGIKLDGTGVVPFCEHCGNSINNHKWNCIKSDEKSCEVCNCLNRHEPWCKHFKPKVETPINESVCWSCKTVLPKHTTGCIYSRKDTLKIKCTSCFKMYGFTGIEVSYPDISCLKCKGLYTKYFMDDILCSTCGYPTHSHSVFCIRFQREKDAASATTNNKTIKCYG